MDICNDLFGFEAYLAARGGRHREQPPPTQRRNPAPGRPYLDFVVTVDFSVSWEEALEERQVFQLLDVRAVELACLYHVPCTIHCLGPKSAGLRRGLCLPTLWCQRRRRQ